MEFWDCNLSYGPDIADGQVKGCEDFVELKACAGRAGLAGGLVIKAFEEVRRANQDLARDLRGETDYRGVWRLLPSCTGETPAPAELPAAMATDRIAALTVCPQKHRYLPEKFVIGDYLEMAAERRIPVLLNTARGLSIEQAAGIMRDFPDLTCILTYANCWPSDRILRPFLDAYPNLYLDMAYILTDGWLQDMLRVYPATRILFGSAFPVSYIGAHMMVIRHSGMSEGDQRLIAGGNYLRLLKEARYA